MQTIERVVLTTFIFVSATAKLRFFPFGDYISQTLGSLSDFPFVPVIEWTDTTILLLLTCNYAIKAAAHLRVLKMLPFQKIIHALILGFFLPSLCLSRTRIHKKTQAAVVKVSSSGSSSNNTGEKAHLLPSSNTNLSGSTLSSPPAFFTDASVVYFVFVLITFCSVFLSYFLDYILQSENVWPLPTLSQAWGNKPGNMLGRWGAVQGGFLFALIQVKRWIF